ncbi:energy-coupling factor ABC transporter permease [Cyanobium sp. WAJ14-Wanaka]|uniref:energy-coupling factor ABC transporter permease n=1 Tax=Cyanobium sp. WAJ14-Wanaka TaxID=2823725 RepID=UPI0020CB93AB|nr:energy-coupling factor ABC transporter permease [Cyanobium sp. WAJ14-Wanaka]MCP9774297.1 energy-coupling factor ABC transporter permease [Cyanobium sp. WAJ14-Wanaka]
MHIHPGILAAPKIIGANYTALVTLAGFAPALLKKPLLLVKTIAAALIFSLLMQVVHFPVGPSELHLVGASIVYFLFGFLPAMFGFAIGLLLQGLVFEPQDLMHLGVNTLSLILPLIATHQLLGKRFFAKGENGLAVNWAQIVKFDAIYYSGVVVMVGFWLLNGSEATPLQSWATWAISYLPIVLIEPLLTYLAIKAVQGSKPGSWLRNLTSAGSLKLQGS